MYLWKNEGTSMKHSQTMGDLLMEYKTLIGLPENMPRDDAYVTGMADGITEVTKQLNEIYELHYFCKMSLEESCFILEDIRALLEKYGVTLEDS